MGPKMQQRERKAHARFLERSQHLHRHLPATLDADKRAAYFAEVEALILDHARPIVPVVRISSEVSYELMIYTPRLSNAFHEATGLRKSRPKEMWLSKP